MTSREVPIAPLPATTKAGKNKGWLARYRRNLSTVNRPRNHQPGWRYSQRPKNKNSPTKSDIHKISDHTTHWSSADASKFLGFRRGENNLIE